LKEARGAPELSVEGAVVMPGFADPGLRLSLMPEDTRKPKKIGDFSSESLTLMRSCLAHGTLNVQVKANAGDGGFRSDLSVLRKLAGLNDQPVRIMRTWYLNRLSEALHDSNHDHNASFGFLRQRNLAHSVEVCSDSNAGLQDRIWNAAAAKSLDVNLLWPGGSADILSELLHRASPRTVYAPSDLTPAECGILAKQSAFTVFSPNKELLEERGGDAARQIAAAGGAVALCSGYDPTHTPAFSMQMALALAVLRLRLTPEQAIAAATINAAHAMGIGHFTGSLEAGKRADLLVLNVPDYREIPRRIGVNNVTMAIRDGKIALNRSGTKVRIT